MKQTRRNNKSTFKTVAQIGFAFDYLSFVSLSKSAYPSSPSGWHLDFWPPRIQNRVSLACLQLAGKVQ
jgi:hypothetical protein